MCPTPATETRTSRRQRAGCIIFLKNGCANILSNGCGLTDAGDRYRCFEGAIVEVTSLPASGVFAQAMAPAKTADTSKGKTLVDAKGMTRYTFDKDSGGKSACSGQCAANWLPLKAEAGAKASGDWTLVTRDDGS